ncbi:uncharacterized protein LOC121420435 isoform X1 [Lytechinus variegatus]|uniref:uncharacterized protein LOC121420435 isoform X1 n=1 Tax=Lytechinus variegatus TaxID=7654 RepID=UPI001BB10738|nr:uncharacterized protein LOC121420435 isoform X1 [Lytechinus variegatus]XP_041471003.1 uncharacterized protein LOC121420435 isoform X1 [Lytechinus variegatus]
MGKKKRGPVGTKKGTLRIAPCIMIRDGGRYRIWVSEATMKGLLEVQSQLLLSSYDEVLSVLLASYKEISGRRHKAQSERLNDWCWNSPVQRTDSCEQSSSSTMQSATSFTVHREKSSKPAPVGIIGNKKATSKRERQLCETTSIVKEEYLEDTLTEQDPLQEGKSEDCRTESEGTLQKSGQPRELEGFFLEHGNLEDRQTPLLEDKSGDGRTERERSLQMSENPRGTSETSLDRESRLTGESRSTVLSTQNQQEGPDTSMKEEESEDDLSYADYDISDDGDDNHKNLVHPSNEGDSRSSTFLMKKEPEDDGSSGGGKANLHETSSCSQQGGNSSMQSTSQGTGHTEEMSGDTSCDRSHGKALPKGFLLQGVQGNDSEFLMGQGTQVRFTILPLLNQAENPQGQSVADRATLPDHNDERLDGDLAVGCGVKCGKTSGDASCDRSYAQGQTATDSAMILDDHNNRLNGDIAVECSLKCERAGDVLRARSHFQGYCSLDSATVSDHEDGRLDGNITVGHDEKDEILGDASQDRSSKGQSTAEGSSVSNHDDGKVDRPIAVGHDEKHVHVTNPFQNKHKSSVLCSPRSIQSNPRSKSREDRPFVCTVCNKGFSRKDNLTTHMKIHQAKRRRDQCPFCKKKFLCSNYLRMHIKVHTGEELYVCSFCKKTFFKRQSLDEHVRIHTGEKPFQCSYCDMRFARADAFKRHTRSHTRETCRYCDKTFSQAGDLKTHMEKHSAEKPFQCADCGQSFATKSQVVDHQKTHAGKEPNFCSVCDKRFKRKHDFIRHMRVHTGEKPYHCPVCSKSFSAKRSRSRHMKIHSG